MINAKSSDETFRLSFESEADVQKAKLVIEKIGFSTKN